MLFPTLPLQLLAGQGISGLSSWAQRMSLLDNDTNITINHTSDNSGDRTPSWVEPHFFESHF